MTCLGQRRLASKKIIEIVTEVARGLPPGQRDPFDDELPGGSRPPAKPFSRADEVSLKRRSARMAASRQRSSIIPEGWYAG